MIANCSSSIASFRRVADGLSAILSGSGHITQELLDQIRVLYGCEGTGPIPGYLKVNLETKTLTDLPEHWPYDGFVRRIYVYDAFSADCLNGLDYQGEGAALAKLLLLDQLHRDLMARISATTYTGWTQKVAGRRYQRFNELMELRNHWDRGSLVQLFKTLLTNGVFDQEVPDARYGTPFTSMTATNPDMRRQWTTDSTMAGLGQREENPHLWGPNLITNAGFMLYPSNVAAMLRTVRDPGWYRNEGPGNGIAHIFLPHRKNFESEGLRWDEAHQVPFIDSILEDPCWGNRKRLESQALLLYWLCRTISTGAFFDDSNFAAKGAPWGFRWLENWRGDFPEKSSVLNDHQKEFIISGIQITAAYLLAVQWNGTTYDFAAPSVSSWEEAALPGGCASDTGFIVDAMRQLRDLLFRPGCENNPVIQDVRRRLQNFAVAHHELGNAEDALKASPFADFRNEARLSFYILQGERKLATMVVGPVVQAVDGTSRPTPSSVYQFPERGADSSLCLLAAYHSRFDSYRLRNARIILGIVRFCEDHLMHVEPEAGLGMKRYGTFQVNLGGFDQPLFDSYLGPHFELGLMVPELVKGLFSRAVSSSYSVVRDQFETRRAMGTLSARDILLQQAVQRNGNRIFPQKDAWSFDAMQRRQQLALPELSAQWTIGTTAAIIALAKAKLDIVAVLQTSKDEAERELASSLCRRIDMTLARFINLVLSTIVQNVDANGQPVLRADGTTLPAEFNIMESFQAVCNCDGKPVFVPGNHTLPWSAAQFYEGLRLAIIAASAYEELPTQ